MLDGYRFRRYPHPEQPQTLLRWIGGQHLMDNAQGQEDRYFRRCAPRKVGTAGEKIPVDQAYSPFITEQTAFLKQGPSQISRNGAVQFRQAYQRFFKQPGGRPKCKKKSGRQTVWVTQEVFAFIPQIDDQTGAIASYPLTMDTKKFPIGIIP